MELDQTSLEDWEWVSSTPRNEIPLPWRVLPIQAEGSSGQDSRNSVALSDSRLPLLTQKTLAKSQ